MTYHGWDVQCNKLLGLQFLIHGQKIPTVPSRDHKGSVQSQRSYALMQTISSMSARTTSGTAGTQQTVLSHGEQLRLLKPRINCRCIFTRYILHYSHSWNPFQRNCKMAVLHKSLGKFFIHLNSHISISILVFVERLVHLQILLCKILRYQMSFL